ncbi:MULTISPECIES: CaiB/BaiF CoA-transferase family protein [Streptomyces]|uniref:CaiB/BaiF CoA transferase family protein n=1 Tax=Streptomyces TaxID=1883 RepID=UPI0029BC2AEB|nr:CaiB/BaiF CoA-transferase family protein [Streptomyces europaeiscabiei]MDX3715730.1 CaiB/BaiF CoA-transferase family protein [Streptomyces europaeiscabiei]WSG20053.1 CoA transferase [Streptomyces europaeiscabiei]
MTSDPRSGPLTGLRVIELAGIGPAPHAALVLADLGADVVRVEGPRGRQLQLADADHVDMGLRGRRVVAADLKSAEDLEMVLDLVGRADVLLEGMRPGVAERLCIGPQACLKRNSRLVYARVTGWGQHGPLATAVGHDINYVGLSGALHAMGDPGAPPAPPLNLVGDYGGGSMLVLVGILAALFERSHSGRGQVVDAAMVDGAVLLSQMLLALRAMGGWSDRRGTNILDGSAPFYRTYACADGRHVAVGALEPQFFGALVEGLGLAPETVGEQHDRQSWNSMRELFAERFASQTRDEWVASFSGLDACVTPVLAYGEAAKHPHLVARQTYVEVGGVVQAAPAPRFSRTPSGSPSSPPAGKVPVAEVLTDWSA